MDKYQFKIEGLIITNPEGWKDFEIRIKRDDDIAGLLVTSTNRFTFWGDGYDEIHNRFLANYNDKVNVTIDILQTDNTYNQKYQGVVVLTDVKFNLEKRFAEATVEDSSFQGAIQSNKNVKSFLNAGFSKNGEVLDVPTLFTLDYFNAAGVYQGLLNRNAYLLKDSLDFLVRFMTDDTVKGIQSAYFDDVSNWEGVVPYITTGLAINDASSPAPNVSFAECITFLQRTHDLTFDFVTDVNGDPVMRIEDKSFFFQADISDTMRDLEDLSVKVDAERVYSHLEVGNNTVRDSGNCSATTRWFTFQKEDYALRGKGNVDKLLDLTTDFVTDSNAIHSAASGSSAYDDNTFIVLGTADGTQAARFQDVDYCSNNFIYNKGFTNDLIIDRQIASIPNSVTKYLTAATTPSGANVLAPTFGDFGALTSQVTIPVDRGFTLNYDDEQYDAGANYNAVPNPLTYYDVPFAGNFSFEAGINMGFILRTVTSAQTYTSSIELSLTIQRFDSTFNTFKEGVTSPIAKFGFSYPIPEGTFKSIDRNVSATMDCSTGDRVVVRINMVLVDGLNTSDIDWSLDVDPNTFFRCIGAAADAGTFKVFDPNSFKARLYTYEKNVSLTRSDNLRANTRNALVINELSDTTLDKIVWIEEMVNNIETGETTFIMIN